MEIEDHYSQLLGIRVPWEISKVDLDLSAPACCCAGRHRADIEIEYTDVTGACLSRQVRCKAHGVRTVKVPWTGKHSRFTLLFEGFAVRVLQVARGIEEARKLLGLNWHQVNAIKTRAVRRGWSRRQAVTIPYLGIDEKQFRKGHKTISSLVDLQQGRVVDVVEDRTEAACQALIEQSLTPEQQQQVTGVALDMWEGV